MIEIPSDVKLKDPVSLSVKLSEVQAKLACSKEQQNDFGKYAYRNVEDILQELKPLLKENQLIVTMTDRLIEVGGNTYIESVARLSHADPHRIYELSKENQIEASAFAREQKDKRGMSSEQMTGSASSYARKYALGALFLISGEACPDYASDMDNHLKNVNRDLSEEKKKNRLPNDSPSKGKGKGKGTSKLDNAIKDLGVMIDISKDVMKGIDSPIPCDKYIGKKVKDWSDAQFDYIYRNRLKIFPNHPNFIQVMDEVSEAKSQADEVPM